MPVNQISNARIDEISRDRNNTLVTVTYRDRRGNRRNEQTVRLVVGSNTLILNTNGAPVPAGVLRVGMIIDATISSAMTRSIPPQANAFRIEIVRRPREEEITVGGIVNVDRNNRSFTTISDRDFSTVIRFNVPAEAVILDRMGRPMNFSRLMPGMRVRVRHANFMTAGIPPQTTAFEVQVL